MEQELRILILEDVATDAELMERELRKTEIPFTSRRVETKESFLKELNDFSPDIILADYKVPLFDGMSALKLARELAPSIPIIIVTGALRDEKAADCIKEGAADYVVKHHLVRLGPAVESALRHKQEIEEKERAEKELAQLYEVLRLITKILRHDLSNHLNVVRLGIEVFEVNKNEKHLKSALEATQKSVQLIERMRELERFITSGGNLKPYRAKEIITSVIRDHPVRVDISGDSNILADEAFPSVIENLLRNATLHGKADRIKITIEPEGKFCKIRFADFGTGIPDEMKEKVFKEGIGYGQTKGMGLGLYIVKKTIERYGGQISIEDNKPQGAVFVLRLKSVDS